MAESSRQKGIVGGQTLLLAAVTRLVDSRDELQAPHEDIHRVASAERSVVMPWVVPARGVE